MEKKMGLVPCSECGNVISSSATKCPRCGKGRTPWWDPIVKVIAVFFLITAIIKIYFALNPQ
jgi:RNA polymerase subunit RPABC4/transcription elongation factor Spt4